MAGFLEALRSGSLMDARRLLEADPALVQFREENGVSAVLIARRLGHSDFARELADRHPGIDLAEAAALGDLHRIDALLQEDPHAVDMPNAEGYTPLALAVGYGHLEAAGRLLEAGANPNVLSTDAAAVMPIHVALENGSREIAVLLIQHGSDVNDPDGLDNTPLHYAAARGDLELAGLLVEKGARSGYPNREGFTALEIAEEKGYHDLVRVISDSVI